MTAPLSTSIVTLWPALAPVPELGFALQIAALSAAVGSAVALRAKRRALSVDTWQITTRWATLGLAVGFVIVLVGLVC